MKKGKKKAMKAEEQIITSPNDVQVNESKQQEIPKQKTITALNSTEVYRFWADLYLLMRQHEPNVRSISVESMQPVVMRIGMTDENNKAVEISPEDFDVADKVNGFLLKWSERLAALSPRGDLYIVPLNIGKEALIEKTPFWPCVVIKKA